MTMILQCCNFEVFRVEGASCSDIKWDILRDNQILSLITKKAHFKEDNQFILYTFCVSM